MARLTGGRTVFGQALGIIMLDTRFPRPPGDVGNAATWPFPVQYRIVRGAHPSRIMGDKPDAALLEPFIEAARELEAIGVGAITTSCGFLAAFHAKLASAVAVPMLTSSLLQAPLIAQMVGPRRKIAILTGGPRLNDAHFRGVGWSMASLPAVVASMPTGAVFSSIYTGNRETADFLILEREMVDFAVSTKLEYPDVGALLCECTNFVPYSQAMRRATGLPVYDLYTLVMQSYLATSGHDFQGRLPPADFDACHNQVQRGDTG